MGKSQMAVLEFIHIRSGLARTGVSSLLSSWGYPKVTARRLRQPIWYSSGCLATLTFGMFHKSTGFIEDALLKKETHSPTAAVWEPPIPFAYDASRSSTCMVRGRNDV